MNTVVAKDRLVPIWSVTCVGVRSPALKMQPFAVSQMMMVLHCCKSLKRFKCIPILQVVLA